LTHPENKLAYTVTTPLGGYYVYPSRAAYQEAESWWNSPHLEKQDFIDFCRKRGVEILRENGKLIADWADIAMHTFATQR